MNVRAYVRSNFASAGMELIVARDNAHGTELWSPGGYSGSWSPVTEHVETIGGATLHFPYDVATAVLEAVERHLRTGEGYVPSEARADYLAERARVDKLTDALLASLR